MRGRRGTRRRDARPVRDVEAVLAEAERLRLFPESARRIREISSDPSASLGDMERAVALDPGLGAQLLRLANSPFYGLPRRVATLRQAILVLGFSAVQQLALSLALVSMEDGAGEAGGRLLLHLRLAADAAAALARLDGRVSPHEAFVAGMLHDLGLVLATRALPADDAAFLLALDDGPDRVARERERLGFDHAALGGACLRRWRLPEALAEAVALHHDVDGLVAAEAVLPRVVHLAAALARGVVAGEPVEVLAGALAAGPVAAGVGLDREAEALAGVAAALDREAA